MGPPVPDDCQRSAWAKSQRGTSASRTTIGMMLPASVNAQGIFCTDLQPLRPDHDLCGDRVLADFPVNAREDHERASISEVLKIGTARASPKKSTAFARSGRARAREISFHTLCKPSRSCADLMRPCRTDRSLIQHGYQREVCSVLVVLRREMSGTGEEGWTADVVPYPCSKPRPFHALSYQATSFCSICSGNSIA